MNAYSGPDLFERVIASEKLRERYRNEPAYRLYQVNKARRRNGAPLLAAPEQIKSKRELAAARQRDGAGRFV